MKIILTYVSPNTTTKKVTEALSDKLRLDGHKVTVLNIGEKVNREYRTIDFSMFEDADLLGIGCPIYHMTLIEPMEAFLNYALPVISRRNPCIRAFSYFTYAGITSGKAFANAVKLLKKNGIGLVGGAKIKAPHFYELGAFPDDDALETVRALSSGLAGKEYRPMEWKRVREIFSKRKAIVNILYPLTKIIGKRREQPITIAADKCVGCGICAAQCPVGAIELKGSPVRDAVKCVCCYHCTVCCPRHAVSIETDNIRKAVEFNKKIVGTEQPPSAVYF